MLVLVAHPYDPSIEVTVSGPPYPFGDDLDLDGSMTFSLFGGEVAIYMADDDYVTAPADTPANTYMPAMLLTPFSYQEQMFHGMEPGGRTLGGFGDIRIWNGAPRDAAGWLDPYLHLGWDGRALLLYRGQKAAAFSTFEMVARLTCDGLEWGEQEVSIRLRNGQAAVDRLIERPSYGGSGGADGGADLTGTWKPVAIGTRPFNIEPVLIDAANLVYQFHHGTGEHVVSWVGDGFDVRDKGVPLSRVGDGFGDYDSLVSASIGAGEYKLAMEVGMIRLGAAPAGRVTITPDIGTAEGFPLDYPDSLSKVVETLATRYLGDASFSSSRLDLSAFFAVAGAFPSAAAGLYVAPNENPTVAELLDRLMAGVRGYWGVKFDGKLTIGLLKAPTGTASYTIDAGGILSIQRRHYMPNKSRRLGYERNWTIQSGDEVAGSVDAAARTLYGASYAYAAAYDPLVAAKHPQARDVEVETFWTTTPGGGGGVPVDAEDVGVEDVARQQILFGAERDFYDVAIIGDPFSFEIGALVDITGVTRFGWADPKKLRIVGRAVDDPRDGVSAPVTLTLWG